MGGQNPDYAVQIDCGWTFFNNTLKDHPLEMMASYVVAMFLEALKSMDYGAMQVPGTIGCNESLYAIPAARFRFIAPPGAVPEIPRGLYPACAVKDGRHLQNHHPARRSDRPRKPIGPLQYFGGHSPG